MRAMTDLGTWDYLDRLVECYAGASHFMSDLRELELRLAQTSGHLSRGGVHFNDLTGFMPSRGTYKEQVARRVAWTSQHLFAMRACMVGLKLLVRDGSRWASPLMEQLRLLGFGVRETAPGESPVEVPAQERIDALLASPTSGQVWVVKGSAYGSLKRWNPDLWVNADSQSLFDMGDCRFMGGVRVPVRGMRSLLAARDLLATAFPGATVRAAYLLVNDPDCAWHFQAHDVTNVATPAAPQLPELADHAHSAEDLSSTVPLQEWFDLDTTPVLATHRQLLKLSTAGRSNDLGELPGWAGKDGWQALPMDRAGRSLSLLNELWMRQAGSQQRLVTASGTDLAAAVSKLHGVVLPKDVWRHDLEDCLERGRYIRRSFERPNTFAILPKGVARTMVFRQRMSGKERVGGPLVAQHVALQSRLWAGAPVGP